MTDKRHKRASPWIALSVLCALALCTTLVLCASKSSASKSVIPNPRGQPTDETSCALDDQGQLFPVIDWAYWQSINPDIVAWVSVEGTSIDYAVVQAPTNNPTFYLDHDIYGSWNPYGCPYIDASCTGLISANTVIFGHNMGFDDSMFADFSHFTDESYALSHPTILIQTPEGATVLNISSAEVIEGNDALKRTNFETQGELASWYSKRFEEASMRLANNETATHLFTFVTCSYNRFSNERTLVYAQPQTEGNTLWRYNS